MANYVFGVEDDDVTISSAEMKTGDIGRIVASLCEYDGCWVLQTYDKLICLSNPEWQWGSPLKTPFRIKLLKPNQAITLRGKCS